jgi:hypothetical protein
MNYGDFFTKMLEIEQNYPVETIEYKGIKIWPFIRFQIHQIYRSFGVSGVRKSMPPRNRIASYIKDLLRMLITVSPKVLFLKNAAMLFTDDGSGLRHINGEMVDIFAVPIFDHEKKIIPIVIKKHPRYRTAFTSYINSFLLSILVKLCSCTEKLNSKKMYNMHILINIISELEIKYNIDKNILQIYSYITIFRRYFTFIRPTKLFVACYYGVDRMTASYVAKEIGIPVIELQHGVIYNRHFAYVTKVDIQKNPYPDYVFCFGEGYKKWISPYICKSANIFIVGNYYINFIKQRSDRNKKLFLEKYLHITSRIVVTVAGLDELDNEILDFIEQVSIICPKIYFIYIPRTVSSEHMNYTHVNISIERELDIYQCMQNSHIMSTVNSTCVVESLALGTPVILIDIQGRAKFSYGDFFSPSDAVFYAETPEEYILCIADALKRDRKQISSDATYYYAENPQERTWEAFKILNEHRENFN